MTTIAIIPATEDSVYQAALATFERVRIDSRANWGTPLFDSYTPLGSALANLGNMLAIARGDVAVGGTPISDATRAAILDADGQIRPEKRSQIAAYAAMLNAGYPPYSLPTPPLAEWLGGSPLTTVPIRMNVQAPGILDGELFGINKKLLLVGAVAAYFLFSEK